MSFVQIIFLLGSLAIAGPLLAHLLARPRFRPISFAMMRFLRVGKQQSVSHRRLKNYLILLLRCAIICLLAMLFAGPQLMRNDSEHKARDAYYLALDNSISMAYADGRTTYFDRMRDAARTAIRQAPDDAEFCLFALASGTNTRNANKSAALAMLDQIQLEHHTTDYGNFMAAVMEGSKNRQSDDRVHVRMISDFTPQALEALTQQAQPVDVDDMQYELIGPDEPIDNAAIVTAQVHALTGENLHIGVTLANYGAQQQQRILQAAVNDENIAVQQEVTLAGARRRHMILTIPIKADQRIENGFLRVTLSLDAADGLAVDDTYYLAVALGEHKPLHVLTVSAETGQGFLLNTALKTLERHHAGTNMLVRAITAPQANAAALKWAHTVFAADSAHTAYTPQDMRHFLEQGGRAIFFVNKQDNDGLDALWDHDILPALPRTFHSGLRHLRVRDNRNANCGDLLNPDGTAIKTLCSYSLHAIAVTGYFQCRQADDAVCLWQLDNDCPWLYAKPIGQGLSVLLNTSADDSMGAMTKSGAAVAFCNYLLGQGSPIQQYDTVCGQGVKLPALDVETRAAEDHLDVWVRGPDDRKIQVDVTDGCLWCQATGRPGWIQTLAQPRRFAAVNLCQDETDMTSAEPVMVEQLLTGLFSAAPEVTRANLVHHDARQARPIWKLFAWIIIALVLAEAFIANRMKRS